MQAPANASSLQRKLLRWFDQHQRDLPWRTDRTPYRIWVSEIMLQQTQVATVIDYYRRFMTRFPDVDTLAAAAESDVLQLWEGLGYYRRARQLHAAAQQIVEQHGGQFPTEFDQVLRLPGVGRYTAGAILSIALDQQLPILEGNTIRLFARWLKMTTDPRTTANQKILWQFSESILPKKRCGDFNQALMELGSEICKPRQPLCETCPVRNDCPTRIQGLQAEIPVAASKVSYVDLHEALVIVKRRGRVLLRQCGPDERWHGLWDFPRFELGKRRPTDQRDASQWALELSRQLKSTFGLTAELRSSGWRIRHAVTRYRITLDCFLTEQVTGRVKSDQPVQWLKPSELKQVPLSVTGRKIAKRLASGTRPQKKSE